MERVMLYCDRSNSCLAGSADAAARNSSGFSASAAGAGSAAGASASGAPSAMRARLGRRASAGRAATGTLRLRADADANARIIHNWQPWERIILPGFRRDKQ